MYDVSLGCPPSPYLGATSLATTAATNVATGASVGGPVGVAVGAVASFLGPLGSILRGSDPVKDSQRKLRIDSYYAGAMAGDLVEEAKLRCYAGQTTPEILAYATSRPDLYPSGSPQCAVNDPLGQAAGSAVARGYARAKLAELEARRLAGVVGTTLIGQSPIPTTIAGTVQRALTSPVVLLGGAALLYLLLSRRRA